jgi:UDP-2,3-diacylglucosamine pyrophosphatase LpxH
MSTAFMGEMAAWNIDHKLFALTLDNASSNDVCVNTIVSTLENHDSLLCHGKFFHVRCAAHIINLIARDGVNTIAAAIDNIRASVLIVRSSTLQLEIFMKQATAMGICTKKGVSQDVSTRWNSTYLMLDAAIHYKKVFQRLAILHPDKYRKHAPSNDEWDKASVVCSSLKMFYNVTTILSGSSYPTANLFFGEFSEINIQLMEWINTTGNNGFISAMAKAMKDKFDKYWDMSNVALAVACMLDPRYKMKVVEFYYKEMSANSGVIEITRFRNVVQELFDSYASLYNPAIGTTQPAQEDYNVNRSTNVGSQKRKLSAFLNDISEVDQDKSDLEKYCSEPLLRWPEGENFDILSWWKTHGSQYPVLAMVARDVLAIPASTVASESAFSAGGRVVDKYRSRLDPEVVEALICTKDWIRASRKGKRIKVSSCFSSIIF